MIYYTQCEFDPIITAVRHPPQFFAKIRLFREQFPSLDVVLFACDIPSRLHINECVKFLLNTFGFKPGPTFGKILTFAETMHISGLTREEILSRIDRGIHTHKERYGTAPSSEDMVEILHGEI